MKNTHLVILGVIIIVIALLFYKTLDGFIVPTPTSVSNIIAEATLSTPIPNSSNLAVPNETVQYTALVNKLAEFKTTDINIDEINRRLTRLQNQLKLKIDALPQKS